MTTYPLHRPPANGKLVVSLAELKAYADRLECAANESDICLRRATAWNPRVKFTPSSLQKKAYRVWDDILELAGATAENQVISYRGVPVELLP